MECFIQQQQKTVFILYFIKSTPEGMDKIKFFNLIERREMNKTKQKKYFILFKKVTFLASGIESVGLVIVFKSEFFINLNEKYLKFVYLNKRASNCLLS